MTKAGEKLYGDWNRWNEERDRTRSARVRRFLRGGVFVLATLAVGFVALFGFS